MLVSRSIGTTAGMVDTWVWFQAGFNVVERFGEELVWVLKLGSHRDEKKLKASANAKLEML